MCTNSNSKGSNEEMQIQLSPIATLLLHNGSFFLLLAKLFKCTAGRKQSWAAQHIILVCSFQKSRQYKKVSKYTKGPIYRPVEMSTSFYKLFFPSLVFQPGAYDMFRHPSPISAVPASHTHTTFPIKNKIGLAHFWTCTRRERSLFVRRHISWCMI